MTQKKTDTNNSAIPKTYTPSLTEDKLYKTWESNGYFNPDNLNIAPEAKPYTIILPPPNITDRLHMGHAFGNTIQDLLIRYKRMSGFRTLWLPGTDHAAIATQNVVEKKILKESGKSRQDLGKKKFLKKVWEFVHTTQDQILYQTRKLGSSLDWSRQAFTLDDARAKAVQKMFTDMYKEGIIYRGERIVNWCPRCKSTLADDEIEYKENESKLYFFKYSHDFPITIATTRPETKLGDTAIAVNPKDSRYKYLIGSTIETNFLGIDLKLKVVKNWKVDPKFGTGALGVTPAHSDVDWKIAQENDLKIIKVIDEGGKIKSGFGEFSKLTALEARQMIVDHLKKNKLLIKEETFTNNLSCCYRCGTTIEPLPSLQWFVNVDKKLKRLGNKSLKERAIEAATTGSIKFTPKRFTHRYLNWMENLHDWCISRQIWFGHQIPVYYRDKEIFVGENPPKGKGWVQDPDTLDTWFSSGMWTFSTLGWPDNFVDGNKIGDLKRFHPTQMLETGHEIITLWVSRMIIMSIFALNEIPFENVYLHGMVLDKYGKKMSKSKGNGIDPVDVIEKYGADATRLSLLIGNTPGSDTRFDESKTEKYKNFVNKLWNIARFIISTYDIKPATKVEPIKEPSQNLTLFDRWILAKTRILIKEVTQDLNKYRFSSAGEKLYNFAWEDLADWYLEVSKFEDKTSKKEVSLYILTNLLKLLHPFTPFVTEKIWSYLYDSKQKHNLLLIAPWPKISSIENRSLSTLFEQVNLVRDIIVSIRNARNLNKVDPSKKIEVLIYAGDKKKLIQSQAIIIKNLRTGIKNTKLLASGSKIKDAIYVSVTNVKIYLIDAIDKDKEKKRLQKELKSITKIVASHKQKLANDNFINKAPKEIVSKEKSLLDLGENELINLKKRLAKM